MVQFYTSFNACGEVKYLNKAMQIPVAARRKAWVCGRSLVGTEGSNPTDGMDVCLL